MAISLVGVALSGAGAYANNVIANEVTSFIDHSTVITSTPQDHLSNQQITTLTHGDRVLLVPGATGAFGGGTAGQIYEYIGATTSDSDPSTPGNQPIGLANQNYRDAAKWTLVTVGSKDIVVDAQNTSSIHSLVGAIAAAAAGGLVAVAGSVGVSLSFNTIGQHGQTAYDVATSSFVVRTFQNSAVSYIDNSTVLSAGDLQVTATSTETIQSDAFAGSVALAIGIGGALAGAGVNVTNVFDTDTFAFIDQSDAIAKSDIVVRAKSDSELLSSSAVGVSIAVSLVGLTVAVSLVDTTITNNVQAYISGDSNDMIGAGGDIIVDADVLDAKIDDVVAVTVSVSVGLVAVSGGGLSMQSTIDNDVDAYISGAMHVMALGDINVEAAENAFIAGDAVNVTIAFGLGLAIGVSLVGHEINSDIAAYVDGPTMNATTCPSWLPRWRISHDLHGGVAGR